MSCNTCHPHPPLDGDGVFEDLWNTYAPNALQDVWNKFIGACEAHMQMHEDAGDNDWEPEPYVVGDAPSHHGLIFTPLDLSMFDKLPNYPIDKPWQIDLEATAASDRWAAGVMTAYTFERNSWGSFSWRFGLALNRGPGTTLFDTTYLPSTQTFTPSTTTPGGVTEGRDGPIILPDIVTDATMDTDTNTTMIFGIGWDF